MVCVDPDTTAWVRVVAHECIFERFEAFVPGMARRLTLIGGHRRSSPTTFGVGAIDDEAYCILCRPIGGERLWFDRALGS